MYVNLIDGVPFIVELSAIYSENPQTSFPSVISDELAAQYGYHKVVLSDEPPFDASTQKLLLTDPEFDGQSWSCQWHIVDLSEEELLGVRQTSRMMMNVTPFQAKAALLDADLLDDIEALIADPSTDRKVVLAWNNVTEFRRLSPMVAGIASALGWSDEQLDTLFEAAALKTA